MISTFNIDSFGRDNTGADIITLAGNNAASIQGGSGVLVSTDGAIFHTPIVAAVDVGDFTKVILPPGTVDFNLHFNEIVVDQPDVEPTQAPSLFQRVMSIFG